MDRVDRAKELRDEYEQALDEADRRRAAYHREVLKLHRSGMSLREIAEQLGISHQRVHQIVGAEEPETQKRRRLAGGAAVIAVIVLVGGFAFLRSSDHGSPGALVARPAPSTRPPTTSHRCTVIRSNRSSSFSPLEVAAAADRCQGHTAVVVIDPNTGHVLATISSGAHGKDVVRTPHTG
jgi:hypothetical protein